LNPNNVDETASGSTTAIPAALDLPGQTLQFRNDGTLGPRCSVFNFNPFNYYQTPQERFNLDVIGHYTVNRHFEVYGRGNFTATNVEQQIAPSGVFGNVFEVPLANPFLGAQAQQAIIDQVESFAAGAGLDVFDPVTGANDLNEDGVFGLEDSINVPIRRRTLELGTRSEAFDANQFHFLLGARGDLWGDWTYDLSYQHGESDRTRVRAGYTNVSNIAIALNTVDPDTCITPSGATGPSTCVPLDIFSGGFGSITPEMAQFSSVTALIKENTTQDIVHASATGPVNGLTSPWAENAPDAAFGVEYRQETASSLPDDCLQTPPTSCQGGAGGNQLPLSGSYDVYEAFGEFYLPIIEGRDFIENLNVEVGFRLSDYSSTGTSETWKAGVNWTPVESLRFRAMYQDANRAPNVSELFRPVTTGLDNATFDPCSAGNPNPIDADLRALCESTGVPPALVGVVGDIVSGQVNQFAGTDPNNPPDPETAETITLGVVWSPGTGSTNFVNPVISLDYYDIEIEDFIGTFSGQESLDACYVLADPEACAGVVRINGSLATSGAGVPGFTTNLEFVRAEGLELSASTGYDLGGWGDLQVSFNANYYLTNELQSAPTSSVVDCNGFYGTTCDPIPQFRFVQRTIWAPTNKLELSYLWRYIDGMEIQQNEAANIFPAFRSIDAYNYIDLSAQYRVNDNLRFIAGVDNVFDEDPPVIGNSTGSTAFNSGNTFPSLYDVLGRMYSVGVTVRF
jgi:outer membrane receptor protein involved in Fe transport